MFCKQCGKPIDDGQELCEDCKRTTNANNAQGPAQTANMNSNYNNYNNNANMNNNYNANMNPQAKSKMAAGLLGIFLGAFGVHNFYLGFTGKAVAQLLITILSCGMLSFASGIWGLIEGILILTGSISVDGNGMPLRD